MKTTSVEHGDSSYPCWDQPAPTFAFASSQAVLASRQAWACLKVRNSPKMAGFPGSSTAHAKIEPFSSKKQAPGAGPLGHSRSRGKRALGAGARVLHLLLHGGDQREQHPLQPDAAWGQGPADLFMFFLGGQRVLFRFFFFFSFGGGGKS